MPNRRRGGGDAAPTHAKDANRPARARHWKGPAHSREAPEPAERSGWLVPLAAVVVAAICIVGIAIPAALLSGGSTPDSRLSDEVRKAAVVDDPALGADDSEAALVRDALAEGADLATRADALAEAATALDRAVKDVQAGGYAVGYYAATPDGQEVISLNADTPFYAASSIKGPFVLRAFADGVPEGYRGLVENAIQWSDNDAYYALREERGYDVLADQLESVGAEGFTRYMSFIWMTPRQLASLWQMNQGALALEGEPGDWLRQTFSGTLNSALGALPANGALPMASAYSKAGWIETGDLSCTVDAGLITFTDEDGAPGPSYVVSVMIDKGEDEAALASIVDALASYLYYSSAME